MPRCRRQVLLECPLQVRLVGKPGLLRNLGNRAALAQLRPGQLYALVEQVAMRRQPEALAKCTNQVGT